MCLCSKMLTKGLLRAYPTRSLPLFLLSVVVLLVLLRKEKRSFRLFLLLFLNSSYWNCGGRILSVEYIICGFVYVFPNPLASWIIGVDYFLSFFLGHGLYPLRFFFWETVWLGKMCGKGGGCWWYLCLLELSGKLLFSSCQRSVEPGTGQVLWQVLSRHSGGTC